MLQRPPDVLRGDGNPRIGVGIAGVIAPGINAVVLVFLVLRLVITIGVRFETYTPIRGGIYST